MKKIKILAISLLALALPLAVSAVGQSHDVAKADTTATDGVYGSFIRNEDLEDQIAKQTGGDNNIGTNFEFSVNGTNYLVSRGRYYSYFNSLTLKSDSVYSISTVAEDDPFYQLGQAVVTDSGNADHYFNAIMMTTPVTFNENISIALTGCEAGVVRIYAKLIDANDEHYVQNTWKYVQNSDTEEKGFSLGEFTSGGTGVTKDWNWGIINRDAETLNSWQLNNLKGHQVCFAFVYETWGSYDLAISNITVDTTDSVALMVNKYSTLNPETNLCAALQSSDSYYKKELLQTQYFLDDAGIAALMEREVTGEYSSETNCLALLNYLNAQAGLSTLGAQSTLIVSTNSATVIISILILAITLSTGAFVIIRKRDKKIIVD